MSFSNPSIVELTVINQKKKKKRWSLTKEPFTFGDKIPSSYLACTKGL